MNKNESSLIGFTLLTQASVGIISTFLILNLIFPAALLPFETGFSAFSPDLLALILLAVAASLSFLHLGKPQHASNVFNNLKSSWLSREIAGLILYGTVLLALVYVRITGIQNEMLTEGILVFALISGLLLVFFMSKIYMVGTIPSWNSAFTWQSFYLSAFILGSIFTLFFIKTSIDLAENDKLSQMIILSGILMMLLIFESISLLTWYLHLINLRSATPLKPDFNNRKFLQPLVIRALLIVGSFIISAYIFYGLKAGENSKDISYFPFILLLLTVIIGEILNRWLFYKSYFRVGV